LQGVGAQAISDSATQGHERVHSNREWAHARGCFFQQAAYRCLFFAWQGVEERDMRGDSVQVWGEVCAPLGFEAGLAFRIECEGHDQRARCGFIGRGVHCRLDAFGDAERATTAASAAPAA
jgi:hypothetical protein